MPPHPPCRETILSPGRRALWSALLLLAALAAAATPAAASGPLGPEGGTLSTVVAVPLAAETRLFVSHPYLSGLLVSTDPETAGWTLGPAFPSPVDQIAAAPSAPRTLYARAGGLFRSTDGGRHWAATRPLFGPVLRFAIAPSDANTVYVLSSATSGPGGPEPIVFWTRDGGATWNVAANLIHGSVLAVDPADPSTAYLGDNREIFRLGPLAERFFLPLNIKSLLADPAAPATLYAGGPEGLAKSLDRGATWSFLASLPLQPAESVDQLLADPGQPGRPETLYAVLNPVFPFGTPMPCPPPRARIARSADGGATWTLAAPPAAHVFDLTLDPRLPGHLYAASDDGFLGSTDGGATFTRFNQGILARRIAAVAIDPFAASKLFAADNTSGFSRGLFASEDGGATWTLRNRCIPDVRRFVPDPRTRGTFYALTTSGLFASADGGVHWGPLSPGPGGQILDLAIDPRSSARLDATASFPLLGAAGKSGYALLQSTDRGATWSSLSGPLDPAHALSAVALDPSRPDAVFVCGGQQVFRLLGARFVPIGDLPRTTDTGFCDRLVVTPGDRDLYLLASFTPFFPSGLYASHDHGVHWSFAESGLPSFGTTPNDLVQGLDPATLYLATSTGIYVTHDGARGSWAPFAFSTPTISPLAVDSLYLDPRGTLAAGAGGGVFLFRIGGRGGR